MSFLLALSLAAAPAAASPPPAAPQTRQQRFDAASEAATDGRCGEAVTLFTALEGDGGLKPGSISAAAISVRKGGCLVRLGRYDEGEAALKAGLPALERAGASFAIDVGLAYQALGSASFNRADYTETRQRLGKALDHLKGRDRIGSLSLLSRATAFDPGPEPLGYSEEAIRIIEAEAKPSKDLLAQFHALHARILLNRGQTAEAYAELKQALALSGGLSTRTSVAETSLRGDLALAALLLGKKDDARLYLAWTGAGRIAESPFSSAVSMEPPDCGGEAGLKPEDTAIVEFGIAEDGTVAYADTVYSRGGPRVAAAFSRAAKDWLWAPESLAKIPAFYRAAVRLELRCSATGGGLAGFRQPLVDRFVAWATPRLAIKADDDRAATVAAIRSALTESESKGDAAGQVAAAGLLSRYDIVPPPEAVAILDRAIAAGEKQGLGEPLNLLRYDRLFAQAAARASRNLRSSRDLQPMPDDYLALLASPAVTADPLMSNTLLLTAAEINPYRRQRPEAGDWLKRVADDGRLPEHHPLRQFARLKLANRAAAAGDLASAQAFFASTGLTEQQCALVGATPSLQRTGVSSDDFPMAAMQYGFEGWVRLEFDIGSDGKPAAPRPIAAYPPFVFVDAAQGMTRGFRYETSYRPSGGTACSGKQETIRFVLPQ